MAKTTKTKGFEKRKDPEQYLVAGPGGATHQTAEGAEASLTIIVADNQNTLKSGGRGPSLLENFAFTSSEVAARAVSPASRRLPASRNSFDQPWYIDEAMPSRRHSSAMLSSPRSPSSTTRIFSSVEKCRSVARRMSLIASSAGCFSGPDFCLKSAPCGYDDPEILRTRKPPAVSNHLTADNTVQPRPEFPHDIRVTGAIRDVYARSMLASDAPITLTRDFSPNRFLREAVCGSPRSLPQ